MNALTTLVAMEQHVEMYLGASSVNVRKAGQDHCVKLVRSVQFCCRHKIMIIYKLVHHYHHYVNIN